MSHRFLLNTTEETDRFWPNPITICYLTNYIRSAETGEVFRLAELADFAASPQGKGINDRNHRG